MCNMNDLASPRFCFSVYNSLRSVLLSFMFHRLTKRNFLQSSILELLLGSYIYITNLMTMAGIQDRY